MAPMPELSTSTSLLLAAFPPELAGLDLNPPPGWRVACVGVGALAAAVATTRLIAEFQPKRVLFVGTCGALDSRLKIGDFISASEAIATSLDEREGRTYRPEIERTRWTSTWTLPFPAHQVVVPPGITKTAEGALAFSQLAAAEHLELTGVFAACHAANIPVAAVLAVANRVGPNAHGEWLANHAHLSQTLIASLTPLGLLNRA